jgi:hypothetical protein
MMRRSLATLLIVPALLASLAQATDRCVTNCMPTTGAACNNFPFNANWPGASGEWRYQAVFTPAQLGSVAFRVTDISFAACINGGSFTAVNFAVRMNHLVGAPTTAMDTNIGATPATVYGPGPITYTAPLNTWSPIGLACNFNYNGVDNLVVEIRYTGGTLMGWGGTAYREGVAARIYAFGPGAFSNPVGAMDSAAIKVRLTCADVTPTPTNPPPGSAVNLLLDASSDPTLNYVAASSLGTGPIPLGCRNLDLSPDGLFVLTTANALPTIFVNYQGMLSATGQATAIVNLPALPPLGIQVYTAFVTLGASGLKTVSATGAFTLP